MKNKQLNGPGNFRELRETGPWIESCINDVTKKFNPRCDSTNNQSMAMCYFFERDLRNKGAHELFNAILSDQFSNLMASLAKNVGENQQRELSNKDLVS